MNEQTLAADDLDHATKYVGRIAVVPRTARLIRQRHPCDALGEFGIGDVATGADVGIEIGLLDQAVAEEPALIEAVRATREDLPV